MVLLIQMLYRWHCGLTILRLWNHRSQYQRSVSFWHHWCHAGDRGLQVGISGESDDEKHNSSTSVLLLLLCPIVAYLQLDIDNWKCYWAIVSRNDISSAYNHHVGCTLLYIVYIQPRAYFLFIHVGMSVGMSDAALNLKTLTFTYLLNSWTKQTLSTIITC